MKFQLIRQCNINIKTRKIQVTYLSRQSVLISLPKVYFVLNTTSMSMISNVINLYIKLKASTKYQYKKLQTLIQMDLRCVLCIKLMAKSRSMIDSMFYYQYYSIMSSCHQITDMYLMHVESDTSNGENDMMFYLSTHDNELSIMTYDQ